MYSHLHHLTKIFSSFPTILIVLLLSMFFVPIAPALADGMVIAVDPYDDSHDVTYSNENSQNALISYDNGFQNMILSIGIDNSSNSDMVWLFPVPADPARIVIDILKDIPNLTGEDLSKSAKSNLDGIRASIQATQIYPLLFMGMFSSGGSKSYSTLAGGEMAYNSPDGMGVIVHEHIVKEGITSEIVTAKKADGLYNYLNGLGLDIDRGAIPVLDNYIGEDFSFVVSWISDSNVSSDDPWPSLGRRGNYISDQSERGVFVSFPTNDLYFPLMPTSVYGSRHVPATLRILGHVSPRIFNDIRDFTTTEYYVNGHIRSTEPMDNFLRGSFSSLNYTKIEIDAPSKFLTKDLWISRRPPFRTFIASTVAEYPVIMGIFLLIVSSVLTGIIVGWIMFRDLRNKIPTLALIGLANCLTIIGVIVATVRARTRIITDESKELFAEIGNKGYWNKRILATLLFIFSIPFLFTGFILFPIFDGLGYDFNIFLILLVYVLPIIAFMFALDNLRVKEEDRGLFKQLKESSLSTQTLHGINTTKFAFIPVYSISFLFISWLLVKLVEVSV